MTTKQTTQTLGQAESPSPSRFNLRTVSSILVVLGLFVSGYLSYVKLTEVPMVCIHGGAFDCGIVQNSIYAKMFGIPIAWLGFAVYIILFSILMLENRVAFLRENSTILIFGITLFAFLYSMYLVYVQFVLLQALCPWCLTHEAIMTVLFIISSIRLKRMLSA